jgi:hypothetical protein
MPARRLVMAAFVALAVACGTVPDVTFQDGDAAGPTDATADTRSPGDAAPGDASSADAGRDATTGCPTKAPSGGVCCGSLECIGCKASDCSSCLQKGCATGTVCCVSGGQGNGVACRSPQSC